MNPTTVITEEESKAGGVPATSIVTVVEPSAKCEFCNDTVQLSDVAGAAEAETIADALDIHYIEACKMLTSCSACDKIVEINRLP